MCGVCGCGNPAKLHVGAPHFERVAAMRPARVVQLEADVLGHNNRIAAHNREHFLEHGVLALNLVSSPGSGKTSLLCSVIERLRGSGLELAVIEGDQQTSRDADRIRACGVPALQINTGKGCHLDASLVAAAFGRLGLHTQGQGGILLIENVGNLVCPALWDLGERAKVVVLSVTEGDDKPLKYPDMFAAAALLVINKIDLLPYVSFDVEACIAYARRVQPALEHVEVSATRGDGMDGLIAWLQREAAAIEREQSRDSAEHAR
jgi:hydrogenase nickel incorporation protein HypB